MHRRARSEEAKLQRAEDLLAAARRLATDLGGVRHVTLAAVTEAAGLHPSAVRRYFASREELFLELAERGWEEWRDLVTARLTGSHDLPPAALADVLSTTIVTLPLFCDLLTHVSLSLEGDVSVDRARQYKTRSFKAYDAMAAALVTAGTLTAAQVHDVLAALLGTTSYFWQLSHPTATLAELYRQEPRWSHSALDFEPRLTRLLRATAEGIAGG
ncbi:TetR family transcriptional regulator [Amycolatopsis rhabdoformis]|uniref:TetR family transcriptional regulator n=1 Tax=Amycolatopsis rhabdoformis TaxID=1448059 RepID=A0ABZ1I5C0_9PSEU|nr:TetR family transcriptional regulator [Amycolatopsis rhabdoformis]WSE28688.1 TetR family transcriptional regulator [Amycolatopsis rhabdoformis]